MNPTTNARGGINRTSRREKEGLVASGTTGTATTLATIPTTPNVIPVDRVVDNPVDALSIPSTEADITPITDTLSASKSYLAEAQARADEEQTKYSAGQDMLRALNGQLGQRSNDLNSYREQAGLPEQEALLRKRLAQIRLKTDTIANRDNLSTLEQGALEGKGADSRLVGRQQNAISRDRMLARASEAIDLRTQIADADLIQGNIEGAMDQINAALDAKYTPIEQSLTLEMQFLNNQKDFLTTAQREVADARLANFQEQLQVFKDARNAVNAAVASGGLQPGEAQQLMNLSPEEQMAAANEVIGRVAADDRAFDRSVQQQSLNMRAAELDLSRQRLAAELSQTGNEYGTLDGKPQNATQALVGGYANRLLEAETVLSDPNTAQFAGDYAYGDKLPNQLQTAERQQFEQAKRNFVNAVLRRESGAVISDAEFANAERQYFAQPGDDSNTLKQKAANRNTVINDFYKQANMPRPVFAGDIITDNSGKSYEVAEDGVTLIEL